MFYENQKKILFFLIPNNSLFAGGLVLEQQQLPPLPHDQHRLLVPPLQVQRYAIVVQ